MRADGTASARQVAHLRGIGGLGRQEGSRETLQLVVGGYGAFRLQNNEAQHGLELFLELYWADGHSPTPTRSQHLKAEEQS